MSKADYHDYHNTIYCQDFRKNDLADECVQMVCTSPPYWGLRKYSGEQELIWGGKDCLHEWIEATAEHDNLRYRGVSSIVGSNRNPDVFPDSKYFQAGFCSLCGAWKGAYGLEPTPEMYIDHTIEILREIRRVLRKDGVVFWNIGDSYAGSWGDSGHRPERDGVEGYQRPKESEWFERQGHPTFNPPTSKRHPVLKPKDLCLIPFRVAIAAQEDGWWVRSVIIWTKPNPMPESVTDRPTESHEYILMLTRSARYYWDADAVRMPIADSTMGRGAVDFGGAKGRDYQPTPDDPQYRGGNEQWGRTYKYNGGGRNIRSVWDFPTQPYPEAHFAVFPEKLPELCIKAATPEVGCCNKCGAPWERIVDVAYRNDTTKSGRPAEGNDTGREGKEDEVMGYPVRTRRIAETLGWQSTCKCNADKVPSLVLDPFMGAGTTLWVAKKLNRKAIGYEISEEYCQLAVERIRQQAMRLEV